MERVPRIAAFKHELEASNLAPEKNPDLHKFANRDDIIVRPLNWSWFIANSRFEPRETTKNINATRFAQISKKHFDELSEYGIHVPVSFMVAEKQQDTPRAKADVLAIVDKVTVEQNINDRELGTALAKLRKNLLRYYEDKFARNQSFLADVFKEAQYVYGRVGDSDVGLYLVDVDPFIYSDKKTLLHILREMNRIVQGERAHFALPEYDAVCEGFQSLVAKVESSSSEA
ncbi:MAG: hypothetical protein Athens041674_151 [Parcubacteria group bacterium Athens0416_74]|nr:MAG: hypothetical protein Athens041674_151 [Parcubacteria group bacterium Athens0416_74]